jgi:hypothetical protein
LVDVNRRSKLNQMLYAHFLPTDLPGQVTTVSLSHRDIWWVEIKKIVHVPQGMFGRELQINGRILKSQLMNRSADHWFRRESDNFS